MGLLSNLLGADKKNVEKEVKNLIGGIIGSAAQAALSSENRNKESAANTSAPQQTVKSSSPSGNSWGEEMPAEENQYNFNGPFWLYFENLFNSEFAGLKFEKKEIIPGKRIIYTFYSGASKVLAVELMPESCSAYKFRNDCKAEGLPYLRFYIDHDGWWNTRSYVVGRMRSAING